MASKQNGSAVKAVVKTTEKSEAARREFFKKVQKLSLDHGNNAKVMQDIADKANSEYMKIFGRVGLHPLLHVKGGKQRIRYLKDRDEVWVVYKPALYQMGGVGDKWRESVMRTIENVSHLKEAQKKVMDVEGASSVQEWHGVTHGLKWMHDENVAHWADLRKSFGFIQRLDGETDGPVVCCKTWPAYRCLQVQLRDHVFSKAYMCLVHGRVENKVQTLDCKFAELGSNEATQVMLKNDRENDPFFEWSDSGKWKGRKMPMGKTIMKPLAYYHRQQDGLDYTLMYINILSGITHQVRITMQSLGHPLVSDDRYLPKEQAMSDLKWCPRNFLTEVRSDWFDCGGPYEDPKRRRFERVSLENPLPLLFQQVLEKKLELVEKLDLSADLYVGPSYWSIGDEQLMNAHPKDEEYRKKVTRWCQRKGIHLDAIDRLLLLEKETIDRILNEYKGPGHPEEPAWICPHCMAYNNPRDHKANAGGGCTGHTGQSCPGAKPFDPDTKVNQGYRNWLADPTLHMLMVVNHSWLDARKKVLRYARPSWEKSPPEAQGTPFTELSSDQLGALASALVENLKEGGLGLYEDQLHKVPGFSDIKLPLGAPPEDARINRCRLPGCGTNARWMFTLKAKERIKYTAAFECPPKKLIEPVKVRTDSLPASMLISGKEKEKRDAEKAERDEKRKLQQDERDKQVAEQAAKKAKREETIARGVKPQQRKWKKLESKGKPGEFYYYDDDTGESQKEKPEDFEEQEPEWECIKSKSTGDYYYFNRGKGLNVMERPDVAEIKNEPQAVRTLMMPIQWKRVESTTKPGSFYYFNPATGTNEVYPPTVKSPWELKESQTKKGQFFYWREDIRESRVDPPTSAKPAKGWPPGSSSAIAEDRAKRGLPTESSSNGAAKSTAGGDLPPGWRKEASSKYPGKFYYVHDKTGKTVWERPSVWEKKESSSHKGKFYYQNAITGETKWDKP